MQQAALEKLKNLVRISPVLGSSERQEWLSMVDAMNDKQLHDLEKILTAGLSHVATAPAAPNVSLPQNPVPPLRTPTAPAPVSQTSIAEKKFREKLDRTVAEPEIEGGKEMPELPSPTPVPPKPAPLPRPVGIPGMPSSVEPKPFVLQRPPVAGAPAAAPVVSKPFAPKLPVRPQPPLPPLRPVLPPLPKPQAPVVPPPAIPHPPVAAAVPAIPTETAPDFSQKQASAPALGSAELPKTTTDLERLSAGVWSVYSGVEFVVAVQKIMASSGRHATAGAFQTSPLFGAYIQTGLAALSARTGSDPEPANLLSRAQFEHLTDQLKELHIP